MRLYLPAVLLFAIASTASAQTLVQLPPPNREIPLYQGAAPGSEKWDWNERPFVRQDGYTITQNVVRPTLQYFAPDPAKACGTAVIVAPGGGHTNLVMFLAASSDDEWGANGSLTLFRSWRAAKRPAEIHIFQTGGHGFLKKGGGGDHVIDRLGEWMSANGWLTKPALLK